MLSDGKCVSGDSVDTVTVAMEDKVVGMTGLVVIKVPTVGTSVMGLGGMNGASVVATIGFWVEGELIPSFSVVGE